MSFTQKFENDMGKYDWFTLKVRKYIISISYAFFLCLLLNQGFSQEPEQFFCTTFTNQETLQESDARQTYEADYIRHVDDLHNRRNSRMSFVLPVVFHIIHENGLENISYERIEKGLRFLNDAFSNTGYYDRGTGVATSIQFCLAKQNPLGEATSGITRTTSTLTTIQSDQDDIDLKSLIQWNPLQYVNIYLVKEICQNGSCDVAGYAFFPTAHGQLVDGVVFESSFMGENEADNAVLIHEIGHYLGLYHTFQNGCTNNDCLSQGDRVCDTPPDQTIIPAPCGLPPNSCTTDADDASTNNPFRAVNLGGQGDQDDMHVNFMDYGDLGCYSAFTQGQSDRMEFALLSTRASLLASDACNDPCPNPVAVQINQGDLIVNVGDNILFNGTAQNATSTYWTLNGSTSSMTNDFQHTFNTKGWYELIFFGETTNVLCLPKSDTITIQVICPVVADFFPLPDHCIETGSTLLFENNSTSQSSIEFFYDNISLGASSSISIDFNSIGRHEIKLVAYGRNCNDTLSHMVSVGCNEICENGYDDDDDDLVDHYDPDCCTPGSDFYFLCDEFCEQLSGFPYDINVEWISEDSTQKSLTMPVAGDIDADGVTEVVFVNDQLDISIANGQTGQLERIIPTSHLNPIIAIADLTNDGFGEIIVIQLNNQRLLAYRHDGTLLFRSQVGIELFSNDKDTYISVADFDQNGLPEIYVGNQIFNGQTGEEIVSGGSTLSRGEPYQLNPYFWQKMASVAADILPDDHCADCSGLELIAGNQVMTVNLQDRVIRVEENIRNERDGITAIVDYDQDGDLDVVVTNKWNTSSTSDRSRHTIYIWDGQTDELMDKFVDDINSYKGRLGSMTVGNFDSDNELELAMVIGYQFRVFDNDLSLMYGRTLSEPTCVNIISFDFDLDGILEFVIRDSRKLTIHRAATGSILFSYPLESKTRVESPIVLDIDGDHQAEILVDGNDRIHCFGIPSTQRWANARPVYNQMQFFNVNINNDLSVPPQQQKHHIVGDRKVMNSFLNPIAFLPAQPNLSAEALQAVCMGDSMLLSYELCNVSGIDVTTEISTTIYCGDPRTVASSAMRTIHLYGGLSINECNMQSIKVLNNCSSTFFVITNDNGSLTPPIDITTDFPNTSILECEYENNIDSFVRENKFYSLDLGPDLPWCNGPNNVYINASNHYLEYTWDNGTKDSTRAVSQPGIYWVDVLDSCGLLQRDSIEFIATMSPTLSLGPDTTICNFGIAALNAGSGFISYSWTGGSQDSTITVFQSGQYGVTVQDVCGNISSDEIVVTIAESQSFDIGENQTICIGDSFYIAAPGFRPFRWGPRELISCDTCQITYLKPEQTTHYKLLAIDSAGCVVTDSITIFVDTFIHTQDTFTLCAADSIYFGGDWIKTPGTYEFTTTSVGGCDSISEINIISRPLSLIRMRDTVHHPGSLLQLFIESNSSNLVEYNWSPSNVVDCASCPSPYVNPQENSFIYVSVIDEYNCIGNDTIYIRVLNSTGYYIPNAFSPNDDQINDQFLVYGKRDSDAIYHLKIFNRWGGKVFDQSNLRVNDQSAGWIGTANGKTLQSSVYVYEIQLIHDGGLQTFKGDLHLLR